MAQNQPSLILDIGSGITKVGFESEKSPRSIFPTIVGKPKYIFFQDSEIKENDTYIGEYAQNKNEILLLNHPIRRTIINDFDDYQLILDFILKNVLNIELSEHKVILADSFLCINGEKSKSQLEKLTQIFFEKYNAKGLYIAGQPMLSLQSIGKSSGLVVDIGFNSTRVSPIINQKVLIDYQVEIPIGGHDATLYLQKILEERCIQIDNLDIVNRIKETKGYVATDFENEILKSQATFDCDDIYTYNDDKIHISANISSERFRSPEIFFNPNMYKVQCEGINQIVADILSKLESNNIINSDFYNTILLCGGSSVFNGFSERINKTLVKLHSPRQKINIFSGQSYKYSVFNGGTAFASSQNFENVVLYNSEYQNIGFQSAVNKFIDSFCTK